MSGYLQRGDFFLDRGSPNVMVDQHSHHHIEVNYLERGEATYLYKGTTVDITSKKFALFWAGMPHQLIERSNDIKMIWVNLPLSWFMNWPMNSDFKGDVLKGGIFYDELDTDEATLIRWHADCPKGGELRELAILELEARVRRMALKYRMFDRSAKETGVKISENIAKACQYISENLNSQLTVNEISDFVQLHPNYLMTIFKKELTYSLTQYITRLRIAKAQRLIVTSDQKILQIAFECGFQTPSRFYSAFKEVAGCSPKEFKMKM